ncbi:MAG: peptidase inhibitor family I36 protein [Acidobacteria bacterium]|nr:peptidase inhibitor family I36 protein [Acidobacteriota bacterium]
MRRQTTCYLFLGAALAALVSPSPAAAQNPVIEKILFAVQDIETKEILAEVPPNGDIELRPGDHVRIRAIAVPVGNKNRRYPSASYELGNPAGMVSMSRMNSELGSTDLEVHRSFNPNRPDAVPFLRYKILEDLKINQRMLSGNLYLRLRPAEEPAPEPAPSSPPPPVERRGVTLYEHQDFRGRSQRFFEDDPSLNDNYLKHDMASSVRVDLGCKVTLYEHPNYQGRATVLTEDITDLNGTRVGNDSVSSLKVECSDERARYQQSDRGRGDDRSYRERRGVTLFEHADFQGRSETFYDDDRSLNDNLIRHDSASSVRVDPGCRAVLYEHPDFDGRASVITEDVTYLAGTRVGNDSVSSLEVRCDGDRGGDRYGRNDRSSGGYDRYDDYRRDGRGVTLFEHQDYRGRYETFYDDDERLNDNEIRHDSASSVRVDPGCEAVLYEHPDFQGRATVVTADVSDLTGTRVGNDSVSSLEVVCRRGRG